MNKKLERLHAAAERACRVLNDAFVQEFPVGTRVTWLYREAYRQTGVVETNMGIGRPTHPEMRVLNERTGRLVWVDLSMEPARESSQEEDAHATQTSADHG